jgi:hypothetical protein
MLSRGSTESSPADLEPTVASGWPTGADQVQKAQKPPKTRNANGQRARLPVTSKRYRKPKKIPQFFPRAAGSGGLKMRMGNHPLKVSRSHREATGTKCARRSRPQTPPPRLYAPSTKSQKSGKSASPWLRIATHLQEFASRSSTPPEKILSARSKKLVTPPSPEAKFHGPCCTAKDFWPANISDFERNLVTARSVFETGFRVNGDSKGPLGLSLRQNSNRNIGGSVGIERENHLAVRSLRGRKDHVGIPSGRSVQSLRNSLLVAGWRSDSAGAQPGTRLFSVRTDGKPPTDHRSCQRCRRAGPTGDRLGHRAEGIHPIQGQ